MKYSTYDVFVVKEICIAYPDKLGLNTLEDLYGWEQRDFGVRELIVVDSKKDALKVVKTFKNQ